MTAPPPPQADLLLTPCEAAHHLGITTELLFQYTRPSFANSSGLRSLKAVDENGTTVFSRNELDAFDALLAGPWPSSDGGRSGVPKAIVDHLRAESAGQCARCGSGIGLDNAHIRPWAESRSHHHGNLVRICSRCHREHDTEKSLSTEELRAIKDRLVAQTRAKLRSPPPHAPIADARPQPNPKFVGRETERARLVEALRCDRTIMVTGVGGIGKTELLLQALSDAATRRPIIWINVEQHRSVGEIEVSLRSALSRGGEACSEDAVPGLLDALQACVVFDGVEQALLYDIDAFEDSLVNLTASTELTQVVVTSQVALHGFAVALRLELGALDAHTSRGLIEALQPDCQSTTADDLAELLAFSEGHALTLRLAAALRDHYGGAGRALQIIKTKGSAALRSPGRSVQTRRTSLELCLQTAYDTLSEDARRLLWALAASPAGVFTLYIESGWLDLPNLVEALGELRRWHFVDLVQQPDAPERAKVSSPMRVFVADVGVRDAKEDYDSVVLKVATGFYILMTVLETNYADPNDTPRVMERCGQELSNFLHILHLARTDPGNMALAEIAISVTRALMRYFFVSGLNEQGCGVMKEAAELAAKIGRTRQASGIALQQLALADRADDEANFAAGLALANSLPIDDPEVEGDVEMARSMAARRCGDHSSAGDHAQRAFEIYRGRLRDHLKVRKEPKLSDEQADELSADDDEMHNDISHALAMVGSARLAEGQLEAAARAYRHSLQHQRGASVAVNRGQTLHQIGNSECRMGNFAAAVDLYTEAADIFHFVSMDHYLSNAIGELGYALLDFEGDYPFGDVDQGLVEAALADVGKDIFHTFRADRVVDHAQAIATIRKTFGTIIFVSLTPHGALLKEFAVGVGDGLRPLSDQVRRDERDRDELFPLLMMDLVASLAFYAAQIEAVSDDGDGWHEIIDILLVAVCEAHEWAKSIMRIVDWLSLLLTLRWGIEGASRERLRNFVENYENDVEDWLELDWPASIQRPFKAAKGAPDK